MIPKEKQAAQLLVGKTLQDGWKVIKKSDREDFNTGGVYSSCYEVEKEGVKGFLKAFDYSAASKIGLDSEKQIANIINAFNYEKEILEQCQKSNCKNIIQIYASGNVFIDEAQYYPNVIYLILEFAEEGDIRTALNKKNIDDEWKVRSLHQIAKGLTQLHRINIAHQDLKPSNVVSRNDKLFKITDLGSAFNMGSGKDLPNHLTKDFAGTWEYCPPELLYGSLHSDPTIRRVGCDLYLLGSMVVFYYTNMSMTGLLKTNLDDSICWTNPRTYGNFDQVKSFLNDAFEVSLKDIGEQIEDTFVREKIVNVVRYLCQPDPTKRGHEKNIRESGDNYSLNRIVTIFSEMIRYFILNKK